MALTCKALLFVLSALFCDSQLYIENDEKLTWSDQNALCAFRYGTSLGSIHSTEGNSEVKPLCTDASCWIGLEYISDGSYQWTDGTPFDFGTDTGDNDGDGIWRTNIDYDQYCLKMTKNGFWAHDGCIELKSGICNHPTTKYIVNDDWDQIRSSQVIGPVHILDDLYVEFQTAIDIFQPNLFNILTIGNTLISVMTDLDKSYFRFSQTYVSNTQNYSSTLAFTQSTYYKIVFHLQQDHLLIKVNNIKVVNQIVSSHQIQNDVDIIINNPVSGLKITSSNANQPGNDYNYLCDFNNRFTKTKSNRFIQDGCIVDCTKYDNNDLVAWMGDLDQSSLSWTDYKIEAEILSDGTAGFTFCDSDSGCGDSHCIAFRMQNANGKEYRYCYSPTKNEVELLRSWSGGSMRSLLTKSFTSYVGYPHTLRVEVSANLFVMYLNNEWIGQVTDDESPLTSGSIGLRYKKDTLRFGSLRIMFPNNNKLYTINPTISPITSDPTLNPSHDPTTSIPATFVPTIYPTVKPTSYMSPTQITSNASTAIGTAMQKPILYLTTTQGDSVSESIPSTWDDGQAVQLVIVIGLSLVVLISFITFCFVRSKRAKKTHQSVKDLSERSNTIEPGSFNAISDSPSDATSVEIGSIDLRKRTLIRTESDLMYTQHFPAKTKGFTNSSTEGIVEAAATQTMI